MSTPLSQLIGAYLNEDVFDFYPDVMAAVDDFVAQEPPERVTEARQELSELLRTLDEHSLASWCEANGCGYAADDMEGGYTEFLSQVASRLTTVRA